jgi:DNA-binding NtrC family response regulator
MKLLIVDDEKLLRWSLNKTLAKAGFETLEAATIEEGRSIILQQEPEIVLLDIGLPDGSGMDLLKWARGSFPQVMFVMMTARGKVKDAVEAMRTGAHDYLEKPLEMEALVEHMARVREVVELKIELQRLSAAEHTEDVRIIAHAPPMVEVVRLAHTVAESGAQAILLLGESGVGKDHLARYIHAHSPRRSRPFMVINCAALPETLLESELFGYEKGAFTDAKAQKKGILELADGGTVFMDEIGEMKPSMQAKLLRVLEDWTFKRVGGARDIKVDVRMIAATNQDLEAMVKRKDFREDLYYRLNVFPIHIPPLRGRVEDILPMARYFVQQYNRRFGKSVVGFSDAAEAEVAAYPWPGNVRELKNAVERVMILNTKPQIELGDLQLRWTAPSPNGAIGEEIIPLRDAEKTLIQRALAKTGGNVSQAAKLLEVSRDKLRYKIRKYGFAAQEE